MPVVVFFALLWVSGWSVPVTDLQLKAEPGQDVTLTCEDPQNKKILLLEWSRDLQKRKLFVFRDGRPFPEGQHESFQNRVSLKDDQMKDGDLSVVLENVTVNDTGTYECRVLHRDDSERELNLISTINLLVSPPPGEEDEDGAGRGLLGLIALPVLVVVPVLVLWIYRKKSRGFPAESSDKPTEDL